MEHVQLNKQNELLFWNSYLYLSSKLYNFKYRVFYESNNGLRLQISVFQTIERL